MRQETRLAFNGYLAQQSKINGVESVTVTYTVAPTPAQKLDSAIQESNAFLKKINIIPVDEAEGEAILLGVNGPTASRTNTSAGGRRKPRDVSALKKDTYACKKTNFDTRSPTSCSTPGRSSLTSRPVCPIPSPCSKVWTAS